MSRVIGPRQPVTSSSAAMAWIVLLACWAVAGVFALIWLAALISAALAGGHVAHLSTAFAVNVLRGRTAATWPGVPTHLVYGTAAAMTALAAAAAAAAWSVIARFIPPPADPAAALRHNPAVKEMTRSRAAVRAVRLRPSLSGTHPRRLPPGDIGLTLGGLQRRSGQPSGPALYGSWEDTTLAFMAPRTGKTTALAVPSVLSAPGPVIGTSNKADLWAATAALRAGRQGPKSVWLFDPQHITYQPQTWWWNPLPALETVEDAHRLAGHFVITVDDPQRRDLWGPAAQDLLCALFLAAATSGRSMRHVARWLDEPSVPTPVELLQDAGFGLLASSLRGTQAGAVETRDGIYQTARTAAKALRDEEIMEWVASTRPGLPEFGPDAFALSHDTLYLLSKSRSAAAPLIAGLTDTTMRAAERQAERAGGRLDPPMVVSLDEAANICRIADLPDLYSHLGSRGIVPVTILQSYEQGVTVWGEPGMAALWGAATNKIIGAGVDSARLTRDLATLVGQHDVPVRSISFGEGRVHEQISLRRQDILEPAAIRAMPPGTALLLATGARPALIHARPWFETPRAAEITSRVATAERQIQTAAQRWVSPHPAGRT